MIEKIYSTIENSREKMIQLQTDLSAIPALSPTSGGDGEWNKAEKLKEWLKELGFSEIQEILVPDERVSKGFRPNLIATVPGKQKKCFWIMTHLDVVPPGDLKLWKSDPFRVIEQEGKLIGRGVEDNQQGLVAALFAAEAFLRNGITPEYTVKLLFVADEETGSDYGVKYILKNSDIFHKEDMFLVPDGGDPEGREIEIAEKNVLWLRFKTSGKQCHAAVPGDGNNAFLAGSALVLALHGMNETFTARNSLFIPPCSTFSPTKKEANVPNVNTIPGEDIFYLDNRILPETGIDAVLQEIDRIKGEIEKQYKVTIEISTVQKDASPATPVDTPLVAILGKAIEKVYGKEFKLVGVGGGTVAAQLRKNGYPTVVWSKIAETAHMPNEYILIDNMIMDSKIMATIMMGV